MHCGRLSGSMARGDLGWMLFLALLLTAGNLAAQTAGGEMPVSPGDKMTILYYEDTFSSTEPQTVEAVVDQQGKIFMPLLGEVDAAGKTPAQLEKDLVQDYSKFVEHPLVSVRLDFQQS
jgi:protein involved in polysaccharide export with SLBB domain